MESMERWRWRWPTRNRNGDKKGCRILKLVPSASSENCLDIKIVYKITPPKSIQGSECPETYPVVRHC